MPRPPHLHEALERIEEPATIPVSVDECKTHMRVDFTDDDAYIGALLAAAVDYVDGQGVLGRAMVTQKWRQYVGRSPGVVRLRINPVQEVNAIAYYDPDGVEQSAALANFDIFGNREATTVEPKRGNAWPITQDRPDAIWLEYTSGYGDAAADVPATVRHALLFIVSHWYGNREAVADKAMPEVPMGVTALINSNRTCWYG